MFSSSLYEEVQKLEQEVLHFKTTQSYSVSSTKVFSTDKIFLRNKHKHTPSQYGFPARDTYYVYSLIEFVGNKPDIIATPVFNFYVADLSGNLIQNNDSQAVTIYSHMQHATSEKNKFQCFVYARVDRPDGGVTNFNVVGWCVSNCEGIIRLVRDVNFPGV